MAENQLPSLRQEPGADAHAITPAGPAYNHEYQDWLWNEKTSSFDQVTVRHLEAQNDRGQNFEHREASRASGGDRKFGSALETALSIPCLLYTSDAADE